tara:strand:+ start:125 stop:292 length:168 start_codon:yes stop_codon:yes gene_type:complete
LNRVSVFGFLKIRKSYSKTGCQATSQNLKLASALPLEPASGFSKRLAYWLNPIRI